LDPRPARRAVPHRAAGAKTAKPAKNRAYLCNEANQGLKLIGNV